MSVIVITGASSGIGRSAAVQLGKKKHALGLIARNEEALAAVKAEIEEAGGTALAISCDVAEPDALENAAARIEEALGPIDVWVNCAMALVFGRFEDVPYHEFRRVTDVSYHGYVLGTQAALRRMKPRDKGLIIQIDSALSYRPLPLQSFYAAAKHANRGFTNALRTELMHDKSNVRITVVHFPAINTPLYSWCRLHMDRAPGPQKPIYDPELAGASIVWAVEHPKARDVWVGGVVWLVILGQKFFPGFSDWLASRIAWDGQLTDKPPAPDRQDNLFETVNRPDRSKGDFSDREIARKPLLWTISNQNFWINAAGIALLLLAFLLGWHLG